MVSPPQTQVTPLRRRCPPPPSGRRRCGPFKEGGMVRRSKDLVDLFQSTPGRNLAENGPEPAVASLKATGLAEAPSARRSRREAGETSDPPDAEALLAPDPLQTLPAGLSGSISRRRSQARLSQRHTNHEPIGTSLDAARTETQLGARPERGTDPGPSLQLSCHELRVADFWIPKPPPPARERRAAWDPELLVLGRMRRTRGAV